MEDGYAAGGGRVAPVAAATALSAQQHQRSGIGIAAAAARRGWRGLDFDHAEGCLGRQVGLARAAVI